MTNMRRGFTMIELIFVIVIIGILAAVAIPKLSATRDDAKISNVIANTRTLIGDLAQFYTAKGQGAWDANASIVEATNVSLKNEGCGNLDVNSTMLLSGTFALCSGASPDVPCVSFTPIAGGSLEIVANTEATDTVCVGVVNDPAITGIVGTAGTITQNFGGSRVSR